MSEKGQSRAVFLDRDGTIIREVSYLSRLSDIRLLPNVSKAISMLNLAGFKVVVVSNQSGVARGLFDTSFVEKCHDVIEKRLKRAGASVDAWYFCPHHPSEGSPPFRKKCSCRKPEAGLIKRACSELDIEPSLSFTVGDSLRDLEAGWKGGTRSILVLTGYGEKSLKEMDFLQRKRVSFVAKNLFDASKWIVDQGLNPLQES